MNVYNPILNQFGDIPLIKYTYARVLLYSPDLWVVGIIIFGMQLITIVGEVKFISYQYSVLIFAVCFVPHPLFLVLLQPSSIKNFTMYRVASAHITLSALNFVLIKCKILRNFIRAGAGMKEGSRSYNDKALQ